MSTFLDLAEKILFSLGALFLAGLWLAWMASTL